MILNVGSGEFHYLGAVNIDLRPTADLQADCRHLPFPDGSASHLHALDVLEHLLDPLEGLREWHRVLQPGGLLTVRVPNLLAIGHQLTYWGQRPGAQLDALMANIYGGAKFGPDGMLDRHFHGWVPATLALTLSDAGFEEVSSDGALNMTVVARKF